MNDLTTLYASNTDRERAKKRKIRMETYAWQCAVAGLAVLNITAGTILCGVTAQKKADIVERDALIAQWQARYNAAAAIGGDMVQAYGDLVMQVESDQQAREAQTAAYAELDGYRYIGECTITAYCPCKECCGRWADGLTATGIPASPGIVAVDPEVIPIGSIVIIDGQKYLAADTGVTGNHVDVFMNDHAAAVRYGVKTADVWVVTE